MAVRILHCSTSIENYTICLDHEVAGFTNRGPKSGDVVYLVVKVKQKSLCGARFILNEPTDEKPWPDGDNYINVFSVKDTEFCKPFDISKLREVGGKHWSLKYLQTAKEIKDAAAVELLDRIFAEHKSDSRYEIESDVPTQIQKSAAVEDFKQADDERTTIESDEEYREAIEEVPDAKINIMGTFQTVQFSNETDKMRGLEALINENFYHLFTQFKTEYSILISENRMFLTEGAIINGNTVKGVTGIPDGILIEFRPNKDVPFRINIIEYECHGENRYRTAEKSRYLNATIIPQLMRFASAFSIITDKTTRNQTISKWVDKIIAYLNSDEQQSKKFTSWVKHIKPDIRERSIEREMEKQLVTAFKTNVRVLLIIDELSAEQKETIKNVVSSFKLGDGEENVQFDGHVVRLVQKIRQIDNNLEYALTVQ